MSNEVSPVTKALAQFHGGNFSEARLRVANHCFAEPLPSSFELEATTTQRECLLMETAYRRGYVQGFLYGHLTSKCSQVVVEAWFDKVLFPWRRIRHGGVLQPPPDFPEGNRDSDQTVIDFFTKYGLGQ